MIDAWKFSLTGAGIFVTTVVAGSIQLRCSFKLARRPFIRDLVFYISAVCWTFAVIYRKEIRTAEAVGMYSVKALWRLCSACWGDASGNCWIRHVPARGALPPNEKFSMGLPSKQNPSKVLVSIAPTLKGTVTLFHIPMLEAKNRVFSPICHSPVCKSI